SIDCGVEEGYLDNPTGIWFKPDKEFISTGENHETLPEYQSENEQYGKRYKTLRSFPNGAKNCYTLTLNHAHNNSFRIRASVGYGNYDRKNQPPKFDLYLGVNYWATVNSRSNVCYEIIHVFPADTEYMCLVNTGSGTPFLFFNGDSTFKHFHLLWKWVFVGTNLCRDLQPGAHIGPFGV
ncbi:hypothetical protein Gotri_016397, partial [Gossypium trilobum]|nr:hypothetical protein [Gossypium trilobum]